MTRTLIAALLSSTFLAGAAQALPTINGSFGFTGFGSYTATTSSVGNTSSIAVPAFELVNTVLATYLGSPNNLGVATLNPVTLSQTSFLVGQPINATPTPVSFTVAVNSLIWNFTSQVVSSTGAGNLNLAMSGTLTNSGGAFELGTAALLSLALTQSAPNATINGSWSLSTTEPTRIPEPASFALLGAGLLGLSALRKRG